MAAQKRSRRPQRANGAETRRKLLKAAMTLFAERGYEATSLRSISANVGVDLATLKYHFGDKASLFADVYQIGHAQFILDIQPLFADMVTLESREALRAHIGVLVVELHRYIESNTDFVRLVLYRILEDATAISGLEDELEGIAIGVLDNALQNLIDRSIIRPMDTRAFLAFLISAIPMWFATCQAKPSWPGEPTPGTSPEGRQRSEAFLGDMLERMLLAEEPRG